MGDAYLPYGRQSIEDDDISAVARVLRADYLTTGPEVAAFEADLRAATGATHAAVVNSGTSALHAAYASYGIGPGDEVLTSPMTFAATANAALYLGARPVFADIDPATGLVEPSAIEAAVTERTRAIVPVDYSGQPASYKEIGEISRRTGVPVISDAAHSLGGSQAGIQVGQLADATVLSFHPVKLVTTGEGGAVLTQDFAVHQAVEDFRSHGMVRDPSRLTRDEGPWYMEMHRLGFNYRITDIQCALGRSQLRKLPTFLARRRAIAARYNESLAGIPGIRLPMLRSGTESAWHLYVVQVERPTVRRRVFEKLRSRGIGVQVHYLPVYLHPYYAGLGYKRGMCPNAELFYERAISLPMYPSMADSDIDRVCLEVDAVAREMLA